MAERKFRVFATADIGDAAFHRLRERGYEIEIYPKPESPPKGLIIEKVRSGIDGLITTLRDKIDAEVFEAGKGTLKVVAQYAVGFDNINRADANRYKIPFTNTADVLTEATAEFAFFALAALARKLWSAEHLVRENKWGYWHPYLPFLGDEVTGKTIGILGTGRIGQAVIKKCIGFDMNILCYEAMGPNEKLLRDVQAQMELRYGSGMQRERTSIKYVSMDEALSQSKEGELRGGFGEHVSSVGERNLVAVGVGAIDVVESHRILRDNLERVLASLEDFGVNLVAQGCDEAINAAADFFDDQAFRRRLRIGIDLKLVTTLAQAIEGRIANVDRGEDTELFLCHARPQMRLRFSSRLRPTRRPAKYHEKARFAAGPRT